MALTSVPGSRAFAPTGVPGDLVDDGTADVRSYMCTEAIEFGCWGNIDEVTKKISPPTSTSDDSNGGVVLRDPNRAGAYTAGDLARVCRRGRVFVRAEEAVIAGDAPFVRFAAGAGGSVKGAFRNDGDSGTADGCGAGLFVTSGGTADPPVVELNAP